MIDEVRKQELDIRAALKDYSQDYEELRMKNDEVKKDLNKKLAPMYRELEKLSSIIDRKVGVDDFNERLDSKADK